MPRIVELPVSLLSTARNAVEEPLQKMTPPLPKQRDGDHHGMPANGTEKASAAPVHAAVEMAMAVEDGR